MEMERYLKDFDNPSFDSSDLLAMTKKLNIDAEKIWFYCCCGAGQETFGVPLQPKSYNSFDWHS